MIGTVPAAASHWMVDSMAASHWMVGSMTGSHWTVYASSAPHVQSAESRAVGTDHSLVVERDEVQVDGDAPQVTAACPAPGATPKHPGRPRCAALHLLASGL